MFQCYFTGNGRQHETNNALGLYVKLDKVSRTLNIKYTFGQKCTRALLPGGGGGGTVRFCPIVTVKALTGRQPRSGRGGC